MPIGGASEIWPGIFLDKGGECYNVKHPDFGAVGNGTADDTTAIQACVTAAVAAGMNVFFPAGTYKITSAINIAGTVNRGRISGVGDQSILSAVGCSVFTMPGQGYYGFTIERLSLQGTSTAGIAAIDGSPSSTTNILGGARFSHLLINGFAKAFRLKNAQLCEFDHVAVGVAANGIVFSIEPDSGSAQQCNANRVTYLHGTGSGGQVIVCTFPTATERATDWTFRDCDIQFTGTTAPFTIKDSYYTLENIEFENQTGGALIDVVADNMNAPSYTRIAGCILAAGGAAGAGKIKLRTTGSQKPFYTTIENNDAGSSGVALVDIVSATSTILRNNQGSVNDTTSPSTTLQAGGSAMIGKYAGALKLPNVADADTATLDYYLEGTFTPALAFGGGTTGITYTTQTGTYTRVGRLVTCTIRLTLSSKGSSTGAATLTGLPITIASQATGLASYNTGLTGVTGHLAILGTSGTTASIYLPGGSGVTAAADTTFTNTSDLRFTFTYEV